MQKILLHIAVLFVALALSVDAQDVPRVISYQGVLVGADGKPVNSSAQNPVKITFELIDATNRLVKNLGTDNNVTVVGGLFTKPLDLTGVNQDDFNQQLFLKLTVNNNPYPPIQLYSTISALNIPDGIVTERKIARNAVTSDKIKDGEVDLQDLKPGSTVGEILKWDGTQWTRSQDEGLRAVTATSPITGTGTFTDPLRVTIPSGVPIGTIVAYFGEITNTSNIPDGWLLCDGSLIPTGPEYDVLRTICSRNGLAGTTPDLRGQFLRGAGITFQRPTNNPDPDFSSRTGGSSIFKIGSRQDDALMIHQHRTNAPTPGNNPGSSTFGSHPSNPRVIQGVTDFSQSHAALTDNASAMSNKTSSETRPKNVYVNYIIKAR